MKLTTEQLESMPWTMKKRRYGKVSPYLRDQILDFCKQEAESGLHPGVLRILGTELLRDDMHVTFLPAAVGQLVSLAIAIWTQENHGGGIQKAFRDVTELQWDGADFWLTTIGNA